jgi:hypothetical protein
MIFDPKLIFSTEESKKTDHHYALYKSYNEYMICTFFERDEYISKGYKVNPADFLNIIEDDRTKSLELSTKAAELTQEIEELEQKVKKVRKKRVNKVLMDEEYPKPGDDVISMSEPLVDNEQ